MNFAFVSTRSLFLCVLLLGMFVASPYGQTGPPEKKPEAYLRFDPQMKTGARSYYIAVYMKMPLLGDITKVRASLRAGPKLISTTVEASPMGKDFDFRIILNLSEEDIFKQLPNYKVLVDAYPSTGGVKDAEIKVTLDVNVALTSNPTCREKIALQITRASETSDSQARFSAIEQFLRGSDIKQLTRASVTKDPEPPQPRTVSLVSQPFKNDNAPMMFVCFEFNEAAPPGEYTLELGFNAPAHPELQHGVFSFNTSGPNLPNPTADTRDLEDFLDLGLTLTSSVENVVQDNTTRRVRTTRGASDFFFAPILNLRKVGTLSSGGGIVQVFTPFYIDSKVATGKITENTLALNRIDLGSTYEFRHYLNTHSYPDLMRHALSFKHSSDRDFKQDEVKFTYEFRPILGMVNQPLGSAPDILRGEPVKNQNDKFGLEIVPIVGVELGNTYRVRDPKKFEGVSRNLRRLYFGGNMNLELTKYLRLSATDLYYVRGEVPQDRAKNYFMGSIEAPLGRIGTLRAAHALFFSFERGEQPPFTSPSVNVLKFGYRIRARGILIDTTR